VCFLIIEAKQDFMKKYKSIVINISLFMISIVITIHSYTMISGSKQVSASIPPKHIEASIPTPWNSTQQETHQAPQIIFQPSNQNNQSSANNKILIDKSSLANNYRPREIVALADPTNYGDRATHDVHGNKLLNHPIIVLHETVISAKDTIKHFQTPHPNDADQASYHYLIPRNGDIISLVPLEKRAFGAGNSVFIGPNGAESAQTNPKLASSVNNFAYHISLESPEDGRNDNTTHSGYTEGQYTSLSWLIQTLKVSSDRVTTHYAVDQSGTRTDPRRFEFDKLSFP
jgi:hypothetical protein